jgi:glycerol-3-phosphate dehydrogenase (NAD(P)+)
MGPDQLEVAAEGIEVAFMGAHSGGARTLARIVVEGTRSLPLVVSVAKGLEPETRKRMSEVYGEEVGHTNVVAMGGPVLAPELAEGAPSAAVMASEDRSSADEAAASFRTPQVAVAVTDDVAGLEYCTMAKNVAAIGMGIVDGLAKISDSDYRNAKAALFTQAIRELVELVTALGGRAETAYGLAGLGDTLVTSLGGRNRLYGEMIGEGAPPDHALSDLTGRGMTVEGVESARDVRELTRRLGLLLAFHAQVEAILFDGAPATTLLECMKG